MNRPGIPPVYAVFLEGGSTLIDERPGLADVRDLTGMAYSLLEIPTRL